MRSLKKPNPAHNYDPAVEIANLIAYRDQAHADSEKNRHIPVVGDPNQILIATWNIANLGVHKRRDIDAKVIAEILSWFEIAAIQEVADNLDDFLKVTSSLPPYFQYIFNDRAGNDERSAFIYDTRRVKLGPKVGEVVIVDSDRDDIKLPGVTRKFSGFNRNPYLASFTVDGATDLLIANAHLIFGSQKTAAQKKAAIERRQLEAYALARWCDLRRKDKHVWSKNILAAGDFNIPNAESGDPIFDALTERGLKRPPHGTRVPTNVSNTADYDQIMVLPAMLSRVTKSGVFDFDGAIFKNIYNASSPGRWRNATKYYVSDHRPLWVQFALG